MLKRKNINIACEKSMALVKPSGREIPEMYCMIVMKKKYEVPNAALKPIIFSEFFIFGAKIMKRGIYKNALDKRRWSP